MEKLTKQFNNISNIGYGKVTKTKVPEFESAEDRALMPFRFGIADLEDELIGMKIRYEKMDELDWEDPKFNNEEFEELEELIEATQEKLDALRSQMTDVECTIFSKSSEQKDQPVESN